MFLQPDLFDIAESTGQGLDGMNLPALIERIADASPRPRYAFMVLNLIPKVANSNSGSAGPYVVDQDRRIPLRDWLCDSLVPMAKRDARRLVIVEEVRSSLDRMNMLPDRGRVKIAFHGEGQNDFTRLLANGLKRQEVADELHSCFLLELA